MSYEKKNKIYLGVVYDALRKVKIRYFLLISSQNIYQTIIGEAFTTKVEKPKKLY